MANIDKYILQRTDMIEIDKERDNLFEEIDDMWHGKWSLPAPLKGKPDLREIIDLSPHDALKSGSAILSTIMPHWTVQPLVSNLAEQERAEKTAYAIDYNYKRMNQRGSSTILWDLVHSCLRYDACAVWLDYLPYQFKKPNLRQRHALRGGDFVAVVHNPRTVHIQKDEFGINCVLLSTNMTAKEVVNKWGWRADALDTQLKKDEDDGTTRFIYNDLMLYEGDAIKRIVWGNITDSFDVQNSTSDEFVFMDEKVETPFMPWIVGVGGSQLETESEYSVHPLLAPLAQTHKWKDLNVFQSVFQSEIIKYGRTPRVKTITPNGDGVDIDYEDGATLNLRKGEEADAWRPAPVDPNLGSLVDRVRAEVSSTTLPRILQNPEFAGNTPFASINAMIQTALGGLNPAKVLCESIHREIGLRMVEWCKFAEKPLLAYKPSGSKKSGENNSGDYVGVDPELLDPDSLLITCKLSAEAPTDFNQRLNAGILMNEKLKVPRSDVLEGLGKSNVDSLYEQYVQEQYDDQVIAMDMQAEQAKQQAEIQMQMQQVQMQMQQQMGQQVPPQGGQPQGQPKGGGYPSNSQGVDTGVPQGQGYNPNAGGMSPATGNPGTSLREQVSGQDVTGAGTA
jgi:hypothetical protein